MDGSGVKKRKLKVTDLEEISRYSEIVQVVIQEERIDGSDVYSLSVIYVASNEEIEPITGNIYTRDGNKRYWKDIDRAANYWVKYVPEFRELTLRKLNPFGENL